ncbi:MAG: hypothetical protein Q4F27_05110, partial [Desulfovibrionaceae bacterium]|nr:hypothetical protein [Desulfovibrionaceae bacterium]
VEQGMKNVDLRKLLTLARRPISIAQLQARICQGQLKDAVSDEAFSYAVLWCLKHDLLEHTAPLSD